MILWKGIVLLVGGHKGNEKKELEYGEMRSSNINTLLVLIEGDLKVVSFSIDM